MNANHSAKELMIHQLQLWLILTNGRSDTDEVFLAAAVLVGVLLREEHVLLGWVEGTVWCYYILFTYLHALYCIQCTLLLSLRYCAVL